MNASGWWEWHSIGTGDLKNSESGYTACWWHGTEKGKGYSSCALVKEMCCAFRLLTILMNLGFPKQEKIVGKCYSHQMIFTEI